MPRRTEFAWPDERQCKDCSIQLATENSYGGSWRCKACQAARGRGHRPAQPKLGNNCFRRRDELAAYKVEHGCSDCDYREDWRLLEFDHVPPHEKLFEIGWAWMRPNVIDDDTLWREVAKCEVVCRWCHIRRTAQRATRDPAFAKQVLG